MAKPQKATFERYGLEWDRKVVNDLNLELACYRSPAEYPTKKPREYHLRQAFHMVWPNFQWNEWCELQTWAYSNFRCVPVIGHSRASKCLGRGTPVLLYDGTIIPVEKVKKGMSLMGDDSTPRRVLSLARGKDRLYRVTPSRGEPWVCNEGHILSLKAAHDAHHSKGHLTHRKGELKDIPLREFLTKGTYFKSLWMQYQVGADFSNPAFVPPVDPYIYGSWLADGGFGVPALHKPRGPITDRWEKYWADEGYRIHVSYEDKCPAFRVSKPGSRINPFLEFMRTSTATGEKRVLPQYLTASREIRRQVLAGLLDGDGCAPSKRNSFTITTKYPGLAKDICFLARSLGLYASDRYRRGEIKSLGFVGHYRSVYISGALDTIPTIQKFPKGTQRNDPLCQRIDVEYIGRGDYFGFELDGNRRFLLGDFTVTHNTYFAAHFSLLDYLAAPPKTATTFTTTKFDALKTRLWGDMLRAVESSHPSVRQGIMDVFKITNSSNELKFQIADKSILGQDKFMIQGVATDSADVSAGKIRGQHADRRRIIGDEAQDISKAIFMAILNASSSADFLTILLTNPVEIESEFAEWCEPVGGWGSITDRDLFWATKKLNGMCLHFDGLQSPNIKAGKTIFPFMLTQEYVDAIRTAKGDNSLEWWMYIRGFFPPDGIVSRIWPASAIERAKQHVQFDFDPKPCAALDPAFDSDDCVIHFGEIGRMRNGTHACRVRETVRIVLKEDPKVTPKDYQVAREVKRLCVDRGVAPEFFIQDETGNARGVLAILRVEWSPKVQGVYYGGEATIRPLRSDDVKPANEQVKYFVSELWFRASYLAQQGVLTGLQNCDPKTETDLTARRYTIKQFGDHKLMVAEPKDEMKKRLGRSCDYGDAFSQFGELLARQGLLQGVGTAAPKKLWEASRKLARKAAMRYAEKL